MLAAKPLEEPNETPSPPSAAIRGSQRGVVRLSVRLGCGPAVQAGVERDPATAARFHLPARRGETTAANIAAFGAPQYPTLITAAAGFTTQALKGFADNPMWSSDPKIAPFGKAAQDTRSVSWPQTPSPASAVVFANFIVVDMFGSTVTGTMEPKAAMHGRSNRWSRSTGRPDSAKGLGELAWGWVPVCGCALKYFTTKITENREASRRPSARGLRAKPMLPAFARPPCFPVVLRALGGENPYPPPAQAPQEGHRLCGTWHYARPGAMNAQGGYSAVISVMTSTRAGARAASASVTAVRRLSASVARQ